MENFEPVEKLVLYGLFNTLPDDGIPAGYEWLFNGPIATSYARVELEQKRDEFNKSRAERAKLPPSQRASYEITSPCEIGERDVFFSEWRPSHESYESFGD